MPLCPYEGCLFTPPSSAELKEHVVLHMECRWWTCPHCSKNFFYHNSAALHIGTCASLPAGVVPGVPRERFDARYPLLRIWSLGMALPTFKDDGSRDAFMVAGKGQVWECARNSRDAHFVVPAVDAAAPNTAV